MRAIIFSICLLAASALGQGLMLDNPVLGLVGHWTFNEGSGVVANDSSGYGNTGYLTNSPTWTNGVVGGALWCNGTNSFISAACSLSTAVTVSLWVKPDVLIVSNYYTFASYAGYVAGGFVFQRTGDGNTLRFAWGGANLFNGPAFSSTNVWVHLCCSAIGTNITFYVNGSGSAGTRGAGSSSFSVTAPNTIDIGRRRDSDTQYVQGAVDDVRIYNRDLTASEVLRLYNGGFGTER